MWNKSPKTDKNYKTGHLPLYKAHGVGLRSSQLSQSIDNYLSLSSRGDVWLWVMGIGLGFGHRAPKMAELLGWTIRSYPEATFVLWKPDFGDLHLPFCAMVNTWDSCPILWDGCPCHGMTRPKSYPILSLIVGHAFPYSSMFLHIPPYSSIFLMHSHISKSSFAIICHGSVAHFPPNQQANSLTYPMISGLIP